MDSIHLLEKTETQTQTTAQDAPAEGRLRVIPLGGVGEFGKNAMVLEYGEDMILIDCGQKFPEEEMYGVDVVIPDFSYLLDNFDRLRGIVLTHGHEDHIGAIAYLLRQFPEKYFPVYGSRLTIALVREKLREMDLLDAAELIEVEGGQKYFLGGIEVEFVAVPHSIPMALSLFFHLPIGTVVHTGDYKLDLRQPGHETELEPFEQLGATGRVLLLMADSTNASREGVSAGESEVREGLLPILADAPQTIVLATFSSSLYRVQTVLDLAQELGRRVAICGYSLERNFSIATDLGLLHYPEWLVMPLHELMHKPAHQRLVITTGTQGEPGSALSRLALNSFKGLTIQPGDRVVLSSRIIPGNERPIYRMINHFYRHGAQVFTERDGLVHSSGHACRDEMRRLIGMLRPKYHMPVHGELRLLIKHRDLAVAAGIAEDRCFILDNGMQLEVDEETARVIPTSWAGQVLVDGRVLEGVEEVVLRDRKHLSEDGIITVILVIDRQSHKIIGGPDIVSRGFVVMDNNESLIQTCRERVAQAFNEAAAEEQEEWDVVKMAVRKTLRKYLRNELDRYPMILPVVLEI